ncbi:hypothetical protein [Campylobacter aviculae]|uniref:Uncharacterized protein n=1 Tax=Campylobacter aviculae TaxID=2510190 RepID=A0A4U7BL95_9BACT|nr:hypothetical protein [Campylobacter aviculae]TKX32399.1 hypothetical protein CQA76_03490 [Campylobacter aviculae]
MARRKLNPKKRFKIFKKILLEENKEYWHNVVLLEKLWKKIPQCNTNALNADEVFSIIEKEKVKANVYSICKFFKITLNKTNGKKFVIFNKNNNLIINYRNENDIFYFLGHIFHNFLDGAYFKYPFKKHTWDSEYREKLAKKFAVELKSLFNNDTNKISKSLLDTSKLTIATKLLDIHQPEIIKLNSNKDLTQQYNRNNSADDLLLEDTKLLDIHQPEIIKLNSNKDLTQQYNRNNSADDLLLEDIQYLYITPIIRRNSCQKNHCL